MIRHIPPKTLIFIIVMNSLLLHMNINVKHEWNNILSLEFDAEITCHIIQSKFNATSFASQFVIPILLTDILSRKSNKAIGRKSKTSAHQLSHMPKLEPFSNSKWLNFNCSINILESISTQTHLHYSLSHNSSS